MQQNQDPDKVIDNKDLGDIVQQRFRYQNTYAAIASCALLMNTGVSGVYCEHHEDVLVKFFDGCYEGIQIKTKDSHLPGFQFSDPAIQSSILRFLDLELKYPGKFKSFKIVSNNGFAKVKNDNLTEIVKLAGSDNSIDLTKKRTKTNKFITEASKKFNCPIAKVIETIAKVIPRPDFSNLNDIKKNLAYELQRLPGMGDQTLGKLNEIADQFILRSYNASSKGEEEICEAFLFGNSFEEVQKKTILDNKTITKTQIEDIIKKCIDNPVTHFLKDDTSLFSKAGGIKILEKKLDAGGISSANVSLIKDQKYSFETYISKLVHKLGVPITTGQYNQLQLITHSICQEVYDNYAIGNELFGTKMLIEIRAKLMERLKNDKNCFADFKYEHLLGMAAVLTEDCRVWWSTPFNLNAQ
ncbi:MAG TPA: dsDNA nuclease domain-containing protein [Panacibacter sp.]|nr:dsDNA nuclease domain-containing protein [Panacibacter sp.]